MSLFGMGKRIASNADVADSFIHSQGLKDWATSLKGHKKKSDDASEKLKYLNIEDTAKREEALEKQIDTLATRMDSLADNPNEAAQKKLKQLTTRADDLVDLIGMDDATRKSTIKSLTKKQAAGDQGVLDSLKQAPRQFGDYFTAADRVDGRVGTAAKRIGTGLGAYGTVNVAGRYVSGGGATYNNRGQRDIAGIPFL